MLFLSQLFKVDLFDTLSADLCGFTGCIRSDKVTWMITFQSDGNIVRSADRLTFQ